MSALPNYGPGAVPVVLATSGALAAAAASHEFTLENIGRDMDIVDVMFLKMVDAGTAEVDGITALKRDDVPQYVGPTSNGIPGRELLYPGEGHVRTPLGVVTDKLSVTVALSGIQANDEITLLGIVRAPRTK